MYKYLTVIPARGGSKRIKNKNLVLLNNKPLIFYTIDAALSSTYCNKTIVSTDDISIAEYAKSQGVNVPFLRPDILAADNIPQVDVLNNALKWYSDNELIDAVILLQPTSPFRTYQHINEAVELFEKSNADTLTSVCLVREHPYYMWEKTGDELKPFLSLEHQTVDRRDLPPVFVENGAIYIIKSSLIESGKFYGERIIPYIMDFNSSIDIDTYDDWEYAEFKINIRNCVK